MNTPTPQEQIATLKEQLIQIRKRGDRVEARQDNRPAECEILGNLGIAYYSAQDWDNAIATLTEYLNLALELEDQWQQGVACYYIGLTQQAQGDIGQGVENLCQAYRFFRHLNQEQFYTQVWQHLSQLAQYYYEQNQLTEALEIYKLQIKVVLEFDDLKAVFWLAIEVGKVQYYQGKFQDAIAGCLTVLKYAQTVQERGMESLALAWLGCSHRELNELEPALSYFEQRLAIAQALENHSEQQETLGWLIDITKRLEKHDTTIQYYQIQVELFKKLEDGNNVYSSLYDLAMVQFNLQQYEEALTHFSEAFQVVETLEDNSEKIANCHFMFARCDQGLNQKDDAIANYRKAVDIYIELGVNYWANQALEYLATLQRELRQYEDAITSQQQRLGIVRELGDRVSEQSCLYAIGNLYNDLKEWDNAIKYFNQALSLATELEQKRNQANAYYMLGSSYRNLESKEIAISNYQQAINLYVELEVKDWAAKGLNHLANLHRSLKQYEDAVTSQQQRLEIVRELRDRVSEQSCLYAIGNIYDDLKEWEQAIKYFKLALQLAVELGGQYKQANAYYMLGQCFQGLKRVDEAIESYLQAGGLYKETKTTKWAGNVFNKLGDIYLNKIDGNKAENIEQAITYYKAALEFYTREAYPKDWAMVQVNLGYIYHRRINGRRIENIEQSISYFTAALEVRTHEKYPQKWAELQCYLGTAYTERIKGSKTQNLEIGIAHLESALEFYNHQNDLKNSAVVHLNLGIIYDQRSVGNITENVERALSHCQSALEFYTCEEYPEKWAAIQHRLGNIYKDKNYNSQREKADNIKQAIAAYKAVLEVSNRETLPHLWILAQFGLASAYSKRVRGDKADNLEQAIALYKLILDLDHNTLYQTRSDVYIQASPEQLWSAIQNNLGITYRKRIRGNKADNLEQAIAAHKLALTVLTREDYPQDWADTQKKLGDVYQERIKGNKLNNLEELIRYYEAALKVYTCEDFPEDWAGIQNDLGNVYRHRIKGNKAANVERSIKYHTKALEVFNRQTYPRDWAMLQNNLGVSYYCRIKRIKSQNIEDAILFYNNALQICTYNVFPEDWARTQNNLGNAYRDRIRGEKSQNLERAIAAYKSALIVRTYEECAEDWASIQYSLGLTYTNRIEGEKEDNIEKAIIAYENALEFYLEKLVSSENKVAITNFDLESQTILENESSQLKGALVTSDVNWKFHDYNSWVKSCVGLQINLADSYKNRIKGNKDKNLQKVINYYNAALKFRPREAFPEEWADIKLHLGVVYTNKISEDKTSDVADEYFLSEAIRCYQAALEIYTLEKFPKQWAEIQYFIAATYFHCQKYKNSEYEEKAITAFEESLRVYSSKNDPQRWAEIQNLLGIIYQEHTIGNMADNLEKALNYHQLALTIYTKQIFPEKWAETQTHLGSAYSWQVKGDEFDNCKKSIAAYEAALSLYNKQNFPEEWANCKINISGVYLTTDKFDQKGKNIEKAIAILEDVLKSCKPEKYPSKYAAIQHNLAEAYKLRKSGEKYENLSKVILAAEESLAWQKNPTVNPRSWGTVNLILGDTYIRLFKYKNLTDYLEKSKFHYEQSLEVFTRDLHPERWAESLKCLANVYLEQKEFKKVIALYQQSLQVFTYQSFPNRYAKIIFFVGIVYWKTKSYHLAYEAFAKAIETVDYLRGEIISGDEVKRKLNEEWITLYILMVRVCIHLERYDKALEYADRSKARNLTELIAARDLYGSDIPETTRLQLQQIRQNIAKEKERLQQTSQSNSSYLNQLREEFNQLSPYQPLTVPDIQNLLDKETAVIEWYISSVSNQILTFTVLPNLSESKTKETSEISLWQSSREDFRQLIDWTNTYLQDYRTNKTQWRNSLPQRLATLANILHIDEILESLFQKSPNCKRLILIPHRFLHLFPLHALPISPRGGKTQLLQDIFPQGVSYAPNCQILRQAQNRHRPHFDRLFAIQNPTQDLAFTDIEVEALQPYFDPHHILKHAEAQKAALNLDNAHCAHFSCHGYFNFNNPLLSALILANSELPPPPPQDNPNRYLEQADGNYLDLGQCLALTDILQLNLRECRLVTLSACETGQVQLDSTDEYISLASGFILAGASAVVSSLWAVNDLSTALLMIRFYQNLKNGETVPLALQHAQTWLRETTKADLTTWARSCLRPAVQSALRRDLCDAEEVPFQSPYYWAAFYAVGG